MPDRNQRIAELRKDFWFLEVEAPKPKPNPLVSEQSARTAAIKAELEKLGADVGERPSDFPTRYS